MNAHQTSVSESRKKTVASETHRLKRPQNPAEHDNRYAQPYDVSRPKVAEQGKRARVPAQNPQDEQRANPIRDYQKQ